MSQDTEIVCVDCQNTFPFTAQEQEFFAEKGFTPPKRCRPCRQARKEQGGARDGGNSGGGGRQRPPREQRGADREMYDAVCSDCGVKTQVPFKPSGGRPVLCRDCFKGTRR